MARACSAFVEGPGEVVAGRVDRGAGSQGGEVLVRLDLEGSGDGLVGLVVVGRVAGDPGLLDVGDREVGPGDVVGGHPTQCRLQRGDGWPRGPGRSRARPWRRAGRRWRSERVGRGGDADAAGDGEDDADADDGQASTHVNGAPTDGSVVRPDRATRGRAAGQMVRVRPYGDAWRHRYRRGGPSGPRRSRPWTCCGSARCRAVRPGHSTASPLHRWSGAGRRCCHWPGGPGRGRCHRRRRRWRRRRHPGRSATSDELALDDLQRDVDDVVSEPAAVREALVVATDHTEPVGLGGDRDRHVEAQLLARGDLALGLVQALDTREEHRHEVVARGRRRRDPVDGLDELGQLGVGDVLQGRSVAASARTR